MIDSVVDADTHVIESEEMWRRIDPRLHERRPVVVRFPDDTVYKARNASWLIDGEIYPKPAGKGGFRLHSPSAANNEQLRTDTSVGSRELTDVAARLADMDRLGVQTQVVYPTLFLMRVTEDPELELVLCDAYNAFLGEAWAESGGRIHWVCVPPVLSGHHAADQLEAAKEAGCVGVMMHGVEAGRSIADPSFFPLYERAEALDLPIAIHVGSGTPSLRILPLELDGTFLHFGLSALVAFRDLITNQIAARFPRLRFGTIEAGASWVPYLLHLLSRGAKAVSRPDGALFAEGAVDDASRLVREANIFVACEADEDIPYLRTMIGDDRLLIGSDYGHLDPAFEATMVKTLESRADLPPELIEKMLVHNPRSFYALPSPAGKVRLP